MRFVIIGFDNKKDETCVLFSETWASTRNTVRHKFPFFDCPCKVTFSLADCVILPRPETDFTERFNDCVESLEEEIKAREKDIECITTDIDKFITEVTRSQGESGAQDLIYLLSIKGQHEERIKNLRTKTSIVMYNQIDTQIPVLINTPIKLGDWTILYKVIPNSSPETNVERTPSTKRFEFSLLDWKSFPKSKFVNEQEVSAPWISGSNVKYNGKVTNIFDDGTCEVSFTDGDVCIANLNEVDGHDESSSKLSLAKHKFNVNKFFESRRPDLVGPMG